MYYITHLTRGWHILHDYNDLIYIFNSSFLKEYNTCLVRGGEEPIYLPKGEERQHCELHFAHGFFASALHESAHWLIAGAKRRELVDFGYWYAPDGRNQEQQKLFQEVEVKPQALEWVLSRGAGFRFQLSIDNLNGPESDIEVFKRAVQAQVKIYCEKGLPLRADKFYRALCHFYKIDPVLKAEDFDLSLL